MILRIAYPVLLGFTREDGIFFLCLSLAQLPVMCQEIGGRGWTKVSCHMRIWYMLGSWQRKRKPFFLLSLIVYSLKTVQCSPLSTIRSSPWLFRIKVSPESKIHWHFQSISKEWNPKATNSKNPSLTSQTWSRCSSFCSLALSQHHYLWLELPLGLSGFPTRLHFSWAVVLKNSFLK